MKLNVFSSLFGAALLAACVHAADPAPAVAEETGFDAELAEELGADQYGMKSYIMVILKTGPNDKTITDAAKRGEIFNGHFANIRAQAEAGRLALAGPFSDPEGIKRGLYIYDVTTVEEAEALVQDDPAVVAGIFTPEFTPYYGSAALMKVNELHATIARQNPGE